MAVIDLNGLCSTPVVTFKTLNSCKPLWSTVLQNCSMYHTEYDLFVSEYFDIRHGDEQDEYINLSSVVCLDGNAVGVWPLGLKLKEGKYVLVSNGGDLLPPLLVDNVSKNVAKKVLRTCFDVAKALALYAKLDRIRTRVLSYGGSVCEWQLIWLHESADVATQFFLFVDLDKTVDEIKGGFRKSYRPLIGKGQKKWTVQRLTQNDEPSFSEFKALHIAESGRQTRSDATWSKQFEAVGRGNAFLVLLRDSDTDLVGGGLFYLNNGLAIYAVGAYRRELFKEPLGHVVQYEAIRYMKEKALKWYCIGHRPFASDLIKPTDKEISIGYFKEGFASDIFPQTLLSLEI